MSLPDVTVVVPAFNERRFIADMMTTLRRSTKDVRAQVIVVDNGSTDGTADAARAAGADLVLEVPGTVAAIRNEGARHATGSVLVFLDADVFVTKAWAARIPGVIQEARRRRIVTGSWVAVPARSSWIETHWFSPLQHGGNSHINSGHLIVSRTFFWELGGFDSSLVTGEDVDFSNRARRAGGLIVDDASLKVVHEGYPKTLKSFFRREIWHGVGDCQTWRAFRNSKVALAGFAVLHLQVIGLLVAVLLKAPAWFIGAVLVSALISLAASSIRYKSVTLATRIVTTGLYYIYFVARGVSLYARAGMLGSRRHERLEQR